MPLFGRSRSSGAAALLLLSGILPPLIEGWVSGPSLLKKSTDRKEAVSEPCRLFSSRFDELVGMDNDMETPSPVDDRYYSVPPTQPQLLINTKPRVTLTRFLSNIVKEDPEVRKSNFFILEGMPSMR